MRLIAVLALALSLSACVGSTFTNSVSKFSEVTRDSVERQSDALETIASDERERVATELAEDQVVLRVPAACLAQAIDPDAPACVVERFDGQPLEQPSEFRHILALGDALVEYSDNLALLSSDSSEDRANFKRALIEAASAASGLDGALREALHAEGQTVDPSKASALASIVGDLGGLYLQHRRTRALKSIIVETDPVVQRAAALLAEAHSMERLYDYPGLVADVRRKSTALRRLQANGGSQADWRQAQDELFAAVGTLNRTTQAPNIMAAIGKAHGGLRQAAESGATAEDMKAAVAAILEVAESVAKEYPTLKSDSTE
jgi:hypothetical protein